MSQYAKARCAYCGEIFQFEVDSWSLGARGDCPNCGKPVTLPNPEPPHVENVPIASQIKNRSRHIRIEPIILGLVSAALLVDGCISDAASKTVMQQIQATIQYCTGWILLGLACAINVLVSINKNQD